MSYETSGQESSGTDDVEPRTRCAVTEYISILEDGPGVDGAVDEHTGSTEARRAVYPARYGRVGPEFDGAGPSPGSFPTSSTSR